MQLTDRILDYYNNFSESKFLDNLAASAATELTIRVLHSKFLIAQKLRKTCHVGPRRNTLHKFIEGEIPQLRFLLEGITNSSFELYIFKLFLSRSLKVFYVI
jgi:hypothetical protein